MEGGDYGSQAPGLMPLTLQQALPRSMTPTGERAEMCVTTRRTAWELR